MVGKRSLMLLGPALLSLSLYTSGVAQASSAPRPATAVAGAQQAPAGPAGLRVLPRDRDDFKKGYGEGYLDGRDACKSGSGKKNKPQGLKAAEADYERGYSDGFDSAFGSCDKSEKKGKSSSSKKGKSEKGSSSKKGRSEMSSGTTD
ncbi:hypothetical protein [Sphaerisporangium rhizosphaerae]|uniref:Uncharacterized protein n=1 Tax=Sphaerisporangium rhizosphaerae TaxID=2269375 RepID=A0ABW2NXR1_9ACTN